ncbi:epoxide hydrolase family protein [Blastococcus sp. SYSU D00669]
MPESTIRPYATTVPRAALDDLADRLRRAQWPDEIPGSGDAYGVPVERVRRLAQHWLDRFDWRALEARLAGLGHFVTTIDGQDVAFLHVRSSRPDALPLVLTHGWPGSVVEYLDVVAPLTEPDDPAQPAFHLVVPSLPGFGFSGPTVEAGWDRYRTARAWAELMRRLGYDRYGAVGNDVGSNVSPALGRVDAAHVVGVHVTQLFAFPSGDPAEFAALSEEDQAALAHLQWFAENKLAFNALQSQQPQTLAFALADSPVGLLGWYAQLLGDTLDDEFVVANTAVHWFTRTAASAMRIYWEDAHASEHPEGPTTTPTAVAMFAGDFRSIRAFAERDHHGIVRWNSYDVPGHFAAHESTDVLVGDVREFFAGLR